MQGFVPAHRSVALRQDDSHFAAAGHHQYPRVHSQASPQNRGWTARILSATVSRTAQRWFVSFTVEIDRPIPERHPRLGSAIGIDLGVKALMTGVNNAGDTIVIPSPRALSASLRRLRRASRDHARKRPRSRTAANQPRGWAACTPASRISGRTRCTRRPPASRVVTRRSSSRT